MVDYWETDIITNPQCPHGPTLLFSRKTNNRKFYSCAAFRDRKQCSFFQWYDESSSSINDDSFQENFVKFHNRRKQFTKLQKSSLKCGYCQTCEILMLKSEFHVHKNHETIIDVDENFLRYPTKFLQPKQNSKGESQFHFTESTVGTIFDFLLQLKGTGVLCVGCPYLHEFISNKQDCRVKSMLLDIDYRFLQFYEPNQFQVFNLFNCHMFCDDGWNYVKEMSIYHKNIVVIVDPPFGGRIEPLTFTFHRLNSLLSDSNVTVLLVLPYFMEAAVKHSLPNYSMLDYKVEYLNHRTIKKRSVSSRGSVVRIFTNASPSMFALPINEGYKFCEMCDRWVYNENKHCFKCESCTSKNGGYYRHCDLCRKCVKKTWKHCLVCKICKLPQHNCNNLLVKAHD